MYYSTVISPNNDCVLRDSVGFTAYINFQHKQKWNSIESCCIFTRLIYFWTAIAPEQTDLPFRKQLPFEQAQSKKKHSFMYNTTR